MNIGIVANKGKPGAADMVQRIAELVAGRAALFTCVREEAVPPVLFREPEVFFRDLDLVFSLGGDGTMLHTVQLMGEADVPIMGINMGNLGFMTSVPQEQIERAVELAIARQYVISERTSLRAALSSPTSPCEEFFGLNEVALGWGRSPRIVSLKMFLNEEYVTTYACDGLIISTPTGSTGHSLSAGGPILHPDVEVFVISPICPHTLSSRPLVISDRSHIRIELADESRGLLLALDGQEYCCMEGASSLTISRRARRIRFAQFPDYSYYAILRRKLRWQGSSA